MLTYEDALQRAVQATPSPRVTRVRLVETLHRVLAKTVTARCDLPRFDNAAVDGYALRTADVLAPVDGAPARVAFHVIGTSAAGRPYAGTVRHNEAVRIFTGAQVPNGADAVVMQEHVIRRKGRVCLQRDPKPGQHIRRTGEDIRRGSRVLKGGTRLRPQEIGLLAAVGHDTIPVYQQPTVAILVTGDELKSPGTQLGVGHIYESNSYVLEALVQAAGARATRLGVVNDTLHALTAKLRRGLAYDVLIISGGVSVGEKDFVRQAARRCGVRTVFWRVNIKPGMPLFFGHRGRTLVFGLPGNPVSVFVTFEEFVKPALWKLMGRKWHDGYTTPAMLWQDLQVSPTRRTHFIRVRCTSDTGVCLVEPLNGQGSHQLRSLAQADGWIRVRSDKGPWLAGTVVATKREDAPW